MNHKHKYAICSEIAPYALSKHIGEEIAQAFVRRTGMIAISLRLPWIHTPETFQEEIVPYRDDPKFGASNLWLYIDARDVAQAFRLCLETNLQGYHDFYIGAPDTFMDIDSVELVKSFYPLTDFVYFGKIRNIRKGQYNG
ncbi:MAG: hypothetical protein U9R58_09225 [Chloroflexota bacterium]|nr:hypothetical protein [Chloroflexota bacterium]